MINTILIIVKNLTAPYEKNTSLFLVISNCRAASTENRTYGASLLVADMKDPALQIVFYGPNISQYDIETKKAKILHIRKTENPNYLFLLVDTKDIKPGKFEILFKKGKKIKKRIFYELKAREKGSHLRKGFDSSDVIYLLMPDRFANGNPANDSSRRNG